MKPSSKMKFKRESSRYAHSEGHTGVCYSDDGRLVFTCGNDDDVRIWSTIDDDDPLSHNIGGSALSVEFRDNTFYIASSENFVQAYTFPNIEANGRPLEFSAPVTDLDISPDGTLLAACSCDMSIKITNIQSNKIVELSGHSAPVLTVALDPMLEYLASSSCDGSVKIWDARVGQLVKAFNNVLPICNDFYSAVCLGRPSWLSKTGLYLAIAKKNKVNIYLRKSWELKFDLMHPDIQESISITLFSPCGSFICGATTIGEIVIWDFKNRSVLSYTQHISKAAISGLKWHPTDFEIMFCDRLGHLGTLSRKMDVVLKEYGESDEEMVRTIDIEKNNEKEGEMLSQESGLSEIGNYDLIDEGTQNENHSIDENTNESEENDNDISIEKIKSAFAYDSFDEDTDKNEDVIADLTPLNAPDLAIKMQECFQPSSTLEHFQHRYLVWNSIGIVRCSNYEGENAIDVEFHDTMFHHSLRLNNNDLFNKASLSSKVLLLANNLGDTQSKLLCILLNSWDGTKEWSTLMPPNENIDAVAASGNWVCCATSANYLRFYSYTGMQRHVTSLPGPLVCMNGYDQRLLLIYHMGIGLPDCQNLGYLVLEISDFSVRAVTPCQPVPLFPKSTLKWVGFTDEGTPCIYDSEGILRLSRDHLHWMVACNTRLQCKSDSDHYFVIGVSEKYQNIRCILCKGSYYPMTVPRPTVVEIPLKLPFCEPETERAMEEEKFWRMFFSLSVLEKLSHSSEDYMTEFDDSLKILRQIVIKLFANACRDDADLRAYDIASLMPEQAIQIGIRYATKAGKNYLTEKLNALQPKDWNDLCQKEANMNGTVDSSIFTNEYSGSNPKIEIRNKYGHRSGGDLFEESQPNSCGVGTFFTEKEKEINWEKEESSSTSTINTPINPFKVTNRDQGLKGLSFFNTLKQSNLKTSKPEGTASDKISKMKQSKEPSKGSQPQKVKFVDWFKSNKVMLQSEFPDLKSPELTKVAMKIFRESNQVTQEISQHVDNNDADLFPELKKRKIEKQTKDKLMANTKLSAFDFFK